MQKRDGEGKQMQEKKEEDVLVETIIKSRNKKTEHKFTFRICCVDHLPTILLELLVRALFNLEIIRKSFQDCPSLLIWNVGLKF